MVEILHNNIYSDMDLEYSFGHIIGSDDLFMFVKRGDTTASRFISAYQITDESVYLIDEAFSGGANSLYVNDKDQVGIYYAKQGYSYYGMVTYEYGKLVHHTEYESDESSITLTVEEYEEMQTDPVKVFDSFCREICDGEPSEHLRELFMNAVTMTEEEEQ